MFYINLTNYIGVAFALNNRSLFSLPFIIQILEMSALSFQNLGTCSQNLRFIARYIAIFLINNETS